MYRRILVIAPRDCFVPFDYMMNGAAAEKSIGWNSGNNVFWFAIQKMMLSEGVSCDCCPLDHVMENIGEVNEKYDACVMCPANLFNVDFIDILDHYNAILAMMSIPIYVVGLGAQSTRDYDFSYLDSIGCKIKEFMSIVLGTNGAVACRGHFTGESLKRLGFREGSDYFVVGCPAIYQYGPKLTIASKMSSAESISPLFNGPELMLRKSFSRIYDQYPRAWHISQVSSRPLLYRSDEISEEDCLRLNRCRGVVLELLCGCRLKYFCDVVPWRRAIMKAGFNFCVGTRIHGSIMSILSGVPAFVLYKDSRVREMVEFLDVPHAPLPTNKLSPLDVPRLYEAADYASFNRGFQVRYDGFKQFMNTHGLPWGEDMAYIERRIGELFFPDPPEECSIDPKTLENAIRDVGRKHRLESIRRYIRKLAVRSASSFIFDRRLRKEFRRRYT